MIEYQPQENDDEPQLIDLNNCFCPWQGDRAVLLGMAGTSDAFLPVFTSAEKLHEMMDPSGIPFETAKEVPGTFIEDVPQGLRVILDPYWLDNGSLRFAEISANAK